MKWDVPVLIVARLFGFSGVCVEPDDVIASANLELVFVANRSPVESPLLRPVLVLDIATHIRFCCRLSLHCKKRRLHRDDCLIRLRIRGRA
jgi:hypothetical protein